MKDGLDMAKGPDPQAEAMQQDFAAVAGTDPSIGTGSGGDLPIDRPDAPSEIVPDVPREDIETAASFAHEVAPQPEEEALKQDFNLASGDPSHETIEAREREAPDTPELKPEIPAEFQLPPDLQALNDRLTRKLEMREGFEVGLKKDRGPGLGL